MPSLDALASIPGYGAYVAKRQLNEQQGMQDLQQIGSLLQLQHTIEAQQQEKQLKTSLAQGGTLEDAMNAAIRAGNLNAASRLAPLLEAQRKAAMPKGQAIGSGGLRLADGTIIPPAARPDTTPKAPPQRQRYNGLNVVQEELQPDGTWKQVGSGPRFAPEKPEKPVAAPAGFRWTDDTRTALEKIPGGPAENKGEGLTPENAGKVSMSQQAIDGIGTVRKIIFDKDGNMQKGLIGAMNLPIVSGLPGNSQARIARTAIRNAVEAKLRIETGAAATESEVNRTLARFLPTVADTPESATYKLDELEKFFKGSLALTKGIPSPAKAPKFEEGKVYVDAKGNRAKYVNGAFVPE